MQSVYASYGFYLWLGLVALTALLLIWLLALQLQVGRALWHYRRLVRDVDRGNLEEVLEQHLSLGLQTAREVHELREVMDGLTTSVRLTLQRVGVVRFNPFADTGGDQSFSVAMLDELGNGVVFTSLFSREGCRTYAKPVQAGQSRYALSTEEKEAIRQARFNRAAEPGAAGQ